MNKAGRRPALVSAVACLTLTWLALVPNGRAADLDLTPLGEWPEAPMQFSGLRAAQSGRYAYVTGVNPSGLAVFDLGDKAPPKLVGLLRLPRWTLAISLIGNHAFLMDDELRMLTVDISDPLQPRLDAVLDLPGVYLHRGGSLPQFTASGNRAYFLHSESGGSSDKNRLSIVDISEPSRPVLLGQLDLGAQPDLAQLDLRVLAALGNTVGLAGQARDTYKQTRLVVLSLDDPAAPKVVGRHSTEGFLEPINPLAIVPGRAYLGTYTWGEIYQRSKVEALDLSDPEQTRLLSSVSIVGDGAVSGLCVEGDLVYVARHTDHYVPHLAALTLYDYTLPTIPKRLGDHIITSSQLGFAPTKEPVVSVSEGLACLASAHSLVSLSVSNQMPVRLGVRTEFTYPLDLALEGGRLGVADLDKGFTILDVQNPTRPQALSAPQITPGSVSSVAFASNHAYLAGTDFEVYDISNPQNPRRTHYRAETYYDGVAVSGNLLCTMVGGSAPGLAVFALPSPSVPQLRRTVRTKYSYHGTQPVALSGHHVYVATWGESNGIVEVFDLANPSAPIKSGEHHTTFDVYGIAAAGDLAVVAGGRRLPAEKVEAVVEVLDIRDPANPRLLAVHTRPEFGFPTHVSLSGQHALIGWTTMDRLAGGRFEGGFDGFGIRALEILDLSDPERPQPVGGFRGIGNTFRLAGEHLFAAGVRDSTGGWAAAGLTTLRVERAKLQRILSTYLAGETFGLAVDGNVAFAAVGEAGLQLLDISDPAQPQPLGLLEMEGHAWDVAVEGQTAYVAAGEAGLLIVDASNPQAPSQVGVWNTPGDVRAVLIAGKTAYVADGREGIQILDITDPAQPQPLGHHGTTGFATGLAIHNNDLLVASREAGLEVLDVSNPTQPVSVSTWSRAGIVLAVAVRGEHALVSDGANELVVLDISNPSNLQVVGRASASGYARGIAVAGRFAYVSDAHSGVRVYDLADPTQPRHLGGNTAFEGYRLVISGGKLFAAGGQGGLGVFDLFTPALNVAPSATQAPGSLNLQVDGPPGTIVRIQRSDDLQAWQDWQTVTLGELPQTLSEAISKSQERMFYRAVSP